MEQSINRLNILKDLVLEKYPEDVDTLNEDCDEFNLELCDSVIAHLDDFYDSFLSDSLKNMDSFEKEKLFHLVHYYKSLLFYQGDITYWPDSSEGVLGNTDYVCMRILDNFDFLLSIAKKGGEDVLKEIYKLQSTNYLNRKILIDYLRKIFNDDDLLQLFLLELTNNSGKYSPLSIPFKAILCLYPEEVIFSRKDDKCILLELDDLIDRMNKISKFSFHNFTDVMNKYRSNIGEFKDLIATISLKYSNSKKNN